MLAPHKRRAVESVAQEVRRGQTGMSNKDAEITPPVKDSTAERRGFLGLLSFGAMAGGLAAGYGMFAAHVGRFLFPTGAGTKTWQFVSALHAMRIGESLSFQTPTGAKVVVARQSEGEAADNFIALSSICPHLGCAVHWEAQNERFFCPCHNGAFDGSGKAISGPPADDNQELSRYPLKVENGLLYIEVPTETVGQHQES